MHCSGVSTAIVGFEQVNASWVGFLEAWRFKEKFYDDVCVYKQKQLPGGALQKLCS